MNRTACLAIALLVGSLTMPLAFGQQPQPSPQLPDDVTARQLIAWSWMQKPQPAPQPMPPKDAPVPQTEDSTQSPAPQSEKQPTQTFTGKIVREGTRYVLKVANNSAYQLDEQDLRQYENQDVRVIGTVDKDRNMINVVKIDLLS
jgi:hypothetical protein